MTTVNWAQLTKYQQACLKSGINAGKVRPEETWAMDFAAFRNMVDSGLLEKKGRWYFPTPVGLAVWQQGQVASAPRSVWVAMWWQYGEDTLGASYIVAVYESQLSARVACESAHKHAALKWSDDGLRGVDNVTGGYFEISEMPVLP